MARENQGLKGALIVFVLLTIVFAVVTVILFSEQNKLKQEADSKHDAATQAIQVRDKIAKQNRSLKEIVGFDENVDLEEIEKTFAKDMQLFAANYTKDTQDYRQALQRLSTVLGEKKDNLEERTKELAECNAQLRALNQVTTNDKQKLKDKVAAKELELENKKKESKADRERLVALQTQLETTLKQVRNEQETIVGNINAKLVDTNKNLKKVSKAYGTAKKQIDNLKREKPDIFLGKISWVNQRSGMVWINLGRADALRPQTLFTVYPTGTGEASEVTKKASIKVTQILGEHLAEAKILEDKATDPILPGDKIFTPIWSLGEKRHFALVGFIDLDKNGRDDRERIYSLIELNGGVVDARVDSNGKRQGSMTLNTRYLILGKIPGITASSEIMSDHSTMTREAENLNVETISIEKFLEIVGWKHESKVVSQNGSSKAGFDIESNKSPATSSGTISERFKPRKPPRSHDGSVF